MSGMVAGSGVGRHAGPVSCVDMSADGRMVSGGYDAALRLWRTLDRSIDRLEGHGALINAVRFSPDGSRIASASSDRTTRLWQVEGGDPLVVISGHRDDVNSVCWSPDGDRVATASFDGTARIHRSSDGVFLAELRGHESDVNSVAWQPGGEMLATASDDRTVRLWDSAGTLLATLCGHEDWVDSVDWSPDGRLVASAGLEGVVHVWDVASGAQVARLPDHGCAVKAVAFSPAGGFLATSAYDKRLRVFASGDWREVASVHDPRMWNRTLCWRGANTLATGSFGGTPVRWRIGEHAACTSDRLGAPGINGMALSPDGNTVALASDDGGARLLDLDRGRILRERFDTRGALLCTAFTPDGRHAAFGGWDDRVLIYALDTPSPCRVISGHSEPVNSVAFASDGTRLGLGGFTGALSVWDPMRGELLGIPAWHRGSIKSVVAYGAGFLACGRDGSVRIHDPIEGERAIPVADTILNAVSVSADARHAAVASRSHGVLWLDLVQGRALASSMTVAASARCVAVSPDGMTVAAGHYDGHLQFWSPATGEVKSSKPFGPTPISSLAWRSAGQELVVASWSAEGDLGIVETASGVLKNSYALAGSGQ